MVTAKGFSEKLKCPSPTKELIEKLTKADLNEFIEIIGVERKKPWNGMNVDLFHWIPVLIRSESILQEFIKKYDLDEQYPDMLVVDQVDSYHVSNVLNFTCYLLEHSVNSDVYDNIDLVCLLVKSTSLEVRNMALMLACTIFERFEYSLIENVLDDSHFIELISMYSKVMPSMEVVKSKKDKRKSGKKDPAAKEGTQDSTVTSKSNGKEIYHTYLHEVLSPKFNVPQKYKSLNFKYYGIQQVSKKPTLNHVSSSQPQINEDNSSVHSDIKSPKPKKLKPEIASPPVLSRQSSKRKISELRDNKNVRESLQVFHMNEESIKSLTYKQIFEKAQHHIPKEKYAEFVLAVYTAKAFNGKSEECIELRNQLATLKCLSLTCKIALSPLSSIGESILDEEPYVFSYIAGLINPETAVAFQPSFAALRVFVAYAGTKGSAGDIVKIIGLNLSHGLLFRILRHVLKMAKNDTIDIDPSYLNYFFNLIANLVDVKSMASHLRNAGLLEILIEFLKLRTNFRMTRSGPLQLINIFIKSLPDLIEDFVELKGFTAIIEMLEYEVDFALNNPDYEGGVPDKSVYTHSITGRQVKTIAWTLKLVSFLIKNFQGDEMRNLYDSPILISFNKLLRNPTVFGKGIIAETINVVADILFNEPTAYSILDEAGLIDTFIECFPQFLKYEGDLIEFLPNTIGAISLNKDGLQKVIKNEIVQKYFQVFSDINVCYNILEADAAFSIISCLEELSRHQPDLGPFITEGIVQLFKTAPSRVSFSPLKFYHSEEKSDFYCNKSEEVVLIEESQEKLPKFIKIKETSVLAFAVVALASFVEQDDTLLEKISIEDSINYLEIENLPFDSAMSETIMSLSSIIKVSSKSTTQQIETLLQYTSNLIDEIGEFIAADITSSYIQPLCMQDTETAEILLRKFVKLSCVLSVCSNFCLSANSFIVNQPKGIKLRADVFGTDAGIDIFEKLLRLQSRINIEEIYMHLNYPEEAMNNIVIELVQNFSMLSNKSKLPRKLNEDFNSAQFKNSFMLWYQYVMISGSLKDLFGCLVNVYSEKKQNPQDIYTTKRCIRIAQTYYDYIDECLDVDCSFNLEFSATYKAFILDQLPKSSDLQNVFFLQNGTWIKLKTLLIDSLNECLEYSEEDFVDLKTQTRLSAKTKSSHFQIVRNVFKLYSYVNMGTTSDLVEFHKYHSTEILGANRFWNSVVTHFAIYGFGVFNELIKLKEKLEKNPHFPDSVLSYLASFSRKLYISHTQHQDDSYNHDGRLNVIKWENVMPDNEALNYMEKVLLLNDSEINELLTIFKRSDVMKPWSHYTIEEGIEELDLESEIRREEIVERLNSQKFKRSRKGVDLYIQPQFLDLETPAQLKMLKFEQPSFCIPGVLLSVAKSHPSLTLLLSITISEIIAYVQVNKDSAKLLIDYIELTVKDAASGQSPEDTTHFSNLLSLCDLLMEEQSIPKDLIAGVIRSILNNLTEEDLQKPWFPYVCDIITRAVSIGSPPGKGKNDEVAYRSLGVRPPAQISFPPFPDYFSESCDLPKFIDMILSIKTIESHQLVNSVAAFLLVVASVPSIIIRICESGILSVLITYMKKVPTELNRYQKPLINLLRRCMETDDVVEAYMTVAIQSSLMNKNKKPHSRELPSFIRDANHCIDRSKPTYISTLAEMAYFQEYGPHTPHCTIALLSNDQKKLLEEKKETVADGSDVSMKDVDAITEPESKEYTTGIISVLLQELMSLNKCDLITTEGDSEFEKTGKPGVMPYRTQLLSNDNFRYALFLLQSLTELLMSYKRAKMEFLTFTKFSKKQTESVPKDVQKPVSTALNIIIHQFLSDKPFQMEKNLGNERRGTISLLAKYVIFGLLATVPLKGVDFSQPTVVDPDMIVVRKFTADILIKAIKDLNGSNLLSLRKYGKISEIITLVKFLTLPTTGVNDTPFRDVSPFKKSIDTLYMSHDVYHFSKELLEKKFISVILSVVSDMDINFPFTDFLTTQISGLIVNLGKVKIEYQEQFKKDDGEGDDEDVGDDLDENEEVPDLLKNSTLAVYDVDNDADFDDDFDEEGDFLGGDIEFVYSDGEILDLSDVEEEVDADDNGDDDLPSSEASSAIDDYDMDDDDENSSHPDIEIIELGSGEYSEVSESGSDAYDYSDSNEELDYDSDSDNDIIDMGHIELYEDSEDDYSDDDDDDGDIEELSNINLYAHGHEDDQTGMDDMFDDEGNDDEEDDGDDDSDILDDWMAEHESQIHRRRRSTINLDAPINFDSHPISDLRSGDFSGRLADLGDEENPFLPNFFIDARRSGNTRHSADLERRINHTLEILSVPKSKLASEIPNLNIRSTLARWSELTSIVTGKTAFLPHPYTTIPAIYEALIDNSEIIQKHVREIQEKNRAEKERKRKEEQEKQRALEEANRSSIQEDEEILVAPQRDPVYVTIADEPIDISGTDIDPEFLETLPEDMREDVFIQHVRERRAEANRTGARIPENTDEFLDSLPLVIHDRILDQEFQDRLQTRGTRIIRDIDEDSNYSSQYESDYDEVDHGDRSDEERDDDGAAQAGPGDSKEKSKANKKLHYSAILDKPGVASVIKLMFAPQSYHTRDFYVKSLEYLCHNKQNRSDLVGFLLYVLQEGLRDENSLKYVYNQICLAARGSGFKEADEDQLVSTQDSKVESNNLGAPFTYLPANTTTFTVANQALEVVQYLLESESHMRPHFLSDQSNNLLTKKGKNQNSKTQNDEAPKYPIIVLFKLLSNKLITNDGNLINILTRILQVATAPLNAINTKLEKMKSDGITLNKSHPQLPEISEKKLKKVISLLTVNEVAGKVFQQTISTIQNLSVLKNAKELFSKELSTKAMLLSRSVIKDLKKLIKSYNDSDIDNSKRLEKFFTPKSDQSKLLRVLTALDFLYQKKEDNEDDVKKLLELYKSAQLGPLWAALSDCLSLLQERSDLNHVSTALSPAIESLMVVCKHSKSSASESNQKDILNYEDKAVDFSKEPLENLFYSFTEQHKKILNQMVKNNHKLLLGPFAVLIKNPKILDFDNKRVYFENHLHKDEESKPTMTVSVRRDQVFLDSYRSLFFKNPEEFRKAKLEITFQGESGVDAGGLTREWFQVLSRQMFNPDYGLFIPVNSDMTTFHPNRASYVNPEHLSYFKFVGMIIGKAVYDGHLLDCHFSRTVYKQLLGLNVSMKDMESLDLDYYKSLLWMLENDITDIIVEDFSVESDDFGEHKIIDLIENGRNIAVTEENKTDYVSRIVVFKLVQSVKDQLDSLLQGFHSIIPPSAIKIFDEKELELLISGLPEIDVDDWKNNTVYTGYTASSPQIQWFWRTVRAMDLEERAKLLQFATGTSKVPLNGFKELRGSSGGAKFNIHRVYGSTDKLPSSHTCFNQIDLPDYESYEKLRNALTIAVREGHEGFGFA